MLSLHSMLERGMLLFQLVLLQELLQQGVCEWGTASINITSTSSSPPGALAHVVTPKPIPLVLAKTLERPHSLLVERGKVVCFLQGAGCLEDLGTLQWERATSSPVALPSTPVAQRAALESPCRPLPTLSSTVPWSEAHLNAVYYAYNIMSVSA